MSEIKGKLAKTAREKLASTPKELARRGLADGSQKLHGQFRETSQGGGEDRYGGSQIEDTSVEAVHLAERGAQKLIRGMKEELGRKNASQEETGLPVSEDIPEPPAPPDPPDTPAPSPPPTPQEAPNATVRADAPPARTRAAVQDTQPSQGGKPGIKTRKTVQGAQTGTSSTQSQTVRGSLLERSRSGTEHTIVPPQQEQPWIRTREAALQARQAEAPRIEPMPIKTREAVREAEAAHTVQETGSRTPLQTHREALLGKKRGECEPPSGPPRRAPPTVKTKEAAQRASQASGNLANIPSENGRAQIKTRETVRQAATEEAARPKFTPLQKREAVLRARNGSVRPSGVSARQYENAVKPGDVPPSSPNAGIIPTGKAGQQSTPQGAAQAAKAVREPRRSRGVPSKKMQEAVRSARAGSAPSRIKKGAPQSIREKPLHPFKKRRPPAVRRKGIKTVEHTAHMARSAAKKAKKAKQRVAAAKKAAQESAKSIKRAVQAVAKVIKAIIAAIKALILAIAAGGWTAVVVVLVICLVGLLIASPFGLFFSDQDTGATTVADAVSQLNTAFADAIETIKAGEVYDELDWDDADGEAMVANWPDVLAVYAVRVTTDPASGDEVVTMTPDKLAILTETFWDMNLLSSWTETDSGEDPDDEDDDTITLHIKLTTRSRSEMADLYGFTAEQRALLEEMAGTAYRDLMMALVGDNRNVSLNAGEISDIVARLPEDISPERQEVCLAAHQLVGQVGYFWGGKALTAGWDSRWGTPTTVWAEGSNTTGNVRPYGLDCSGYVDWVFYNATGGDYYPSNGGGTAQQLANCTQIAWTDAQPGDLVFFSDVSHVGIIAGFDDAGNPLVSHCATTSGVVISGISGFSIVAKPNYFTN